MAIRSVRFWSGKKKASVILAVLVLAALGFLYVYGKKETLPKKTLSQAIAGQNQIKNLNKDTDGDGLKDWEEIIYRTDPKNKDSDGDKTSDGEETRLGRNPLVPGPNDEVATTTPLEQTPVEYSFDNLTARLAEKIGSNLIVPSMFNSNATIDPAVGEDLVNETLAIAKDTTIYFNEKDVLVSSDNSKEAVLEYDKKVTSILQPLTAFTRSPLEVFAEAVQNDDLALLASLDKYTDGYKKAANELKKIKTPVKFVGFHAKVINIFLLEENLTKKMREAEKDIISAILGAQGFTGIFSQTQKLTEEYSRLINAIP